jgi:flagellar biosynthesis/type III secretory pathway protein FliH
MTTVSEVYFLVRVGSWDEDDLENWAQERADEQLDNVHDKAYELGHKDGFEEGQDDMYKQALDAVKCLR